MSLSADSVNSASRIKEESPDSDETFAVIAGYTSGGMPYGITWEEWENQPQDIDDEIEDLS